jgi:D-amino-acid dehydrogenase
VHRVLHAAGSARVDGRGMAAALRQAATSRGVEFVAGAVNGIVAGDGRRRRVDALAVDGQRDVVCAAIAVAGGAWTAAVGEWLDATLPVGPTKGQIVHLGVDGETGAWPIVQPLLTHYLVPWPGGRVACGGTFEVGAGFSVHATAAGLHELLRECLTVAPGLEAASYLETRVGLRPTSADDRAVVGRVPGWDNVWVATGHGANGLLQGPYSARVLAHTMAGVALPADEAALPASFDPARFA